MAQAFEVSDAIILRPFIFAFYGVGRLTQPRQETQILGVNTSYNTLIEQVPQLDGIIHHLLMGLQQPADSEIRIQPRGDLLQVIVVLGYVVAHAYKVNRCSERPLPVGLFN